MTDILHLAFSFVIGLAISYALFTIDPIGRLARLARRTR